MSRVSVPSSNVATIEAKALVIEGVSRSRNALIDGDVKDYDWDSGYTCHQLGSGAIVIQLAQPYIVDSMRFVLFCNVVTQIILLSLICFVFCCDVTQVAVVGL